MARRTMIESLDDLHTELARRKKAATTIDVTPTNGGDVDVENKTEHV